MLRRRFFTLASIAIFIASLCECDSNELRDALDDIRTSLNISSWNTSLSMCTWAGVTCTPNGSSLSSLTLCTTTTAPCVGSNSSLPNNATTWSIIGRNLTSLTISQGLFPFPDNASTSLTMLSSLSFTFYSPTVPMQLPVGAGYAMTLSSSNIILQASSNAGANVTSMSFSSSTVPDVTNIASLTSVTITSGTLGTLNWTLMTHLTSISISSSPLINGTLPNWTSTNFPALTSISLNAIGISVTPTSWGTIATLTSIGITSCTLLNSPLPSEWSNLTNLRSITLSSTPMTGPLPDAWANLVNVTIIAIGANFSQATLPSAWTNMTSLISLTISNCGLGGTLPSWPSTTTALTYLGLSNNAITGPLPTIVAGWSKLTTLDISNNPINSTLPVWGALRSLITISMFSCNISGPLPQWGAGSISPMSNLQTIVMNNNSLNSTIPSSWWNMISLVTLNANSANVIGQLDLIWNATRLTSLDVSGNSIGPLCNFTVPKSLQTLALQNNLCTRQHPNWTTATTLTTVNLEGNAFNGSLAIIPSSSLATLRIGGGNQFTGSLSNWTSAATTLTELSASNNRLSGTLPTFSNIVTLLLANNSFSGTLSILDQRAGLQSIDVSLNNLSGSLPNLSSASSLILVNLSHNRFSGSLTLAASLSSLKVFDVACNSLSGTLPAWSSSLSLANVNVSCGNRFTGTVPPLSVASLVVLDLSDQGLSGTLTSIISVSSSPSSKITAMLLGGNSLTGSIPQFLEWENLQRFNVSGNQLSGTISNNRFPSNLSSVDLSNNLLYGTIPVPSATSVFPLMQHFLLGGDDHNFNGTLPPLNKTFPNLTRFSLSGSFPVNIPYEWLNGPTAWVNLTTLSLRKCGFSGTFPSLLGRNQLTFLDLSRNRLGGTLPADLPNRTQFLTTLVIGENAFNGELPSTWSSFSSLKWLNAQSCDLNGTIPQLPSSLVTLLLGNNSFTSDTPDVGLVLPHQLVQLDVSNNNLTTLPSIKNLSNLTMLNISHNHFPSMELPSWNESLTSIVALNVSHNQFIGGIPLDWTTSMTSLASLDASANQLNSSSLTLESLLGNVAFPRLQILWLRENNFTTWDDGGTNAVIGNAMMDVDISNNFLTGALPNTLFTNATNLTSLQLQGNALNSSLPKVWGFDNVTPTSLMVLNISSNNITGPVPYNWGGLLRRVNFSIDLCFNSICGPLPKTLPSSNNSGFLRCPGSPLLTIDCYSRSVTPSPINLTETSSRSLTLTMSLSASPSSSLTKHKSVSSTKPSMTQSTSARQTNTTSSSLSMSSSPSLSAEPLSPSRTGSARSLTRTKLLSHTHTQTFGSRTFSQSATVAKTCTVTTTISDGTRSPNNTVSHSAHTRSASRTRSTLLPSVSHSLFTKTLRPTVSPSFTPTPTRSRTPTHGKTRSPTRSKKSPTPTATNTPSSSISITSSKGSLSETRNSSNTRTLSPLLGSVSGTRNRSETLSNSIILVDSSADSFLKAVKDLTATASALTSVLSAADISNVNTLMLMSYVDCTVNGKKDIDSMRDGTFSSYMISPFMDVGWAAVAWGNLALGALALLLNAVVTAVAAMIDARRRSELSGDLQAPHMPITNAFYTTVMGDVRASTVFPPFPAIGIRFVELWTSGSVLGAFAELMTASGGDEGVRYVTGILVMLSCVGVLVGWQMTLMHRVLPRTTFVEYQLGVLRENIEAIPGWAPWWLLPVGSWRPPPVRQRFDQLFMPHNSPWSAKCRVCFHIGISFISSLLTAVSFVSSDSCEIASSLLAVTYFAMAVFLARFRLYRAPFETPVAVAVFLLLGVQVTFIAAKESAPTWISLVQTLLTILRTVLRMISIALESDMEKYSFFVADDKEPETRRGNAAAIDFGYYDRSEDSDLLRPIEMVAAFGARRHDDDDPFEQDVEWRGNDEAEVEMLVDEEEEDPLRVLNPIDDHVVTAAGTFTSPVASSGSGGAAVRRHVVSTQHGSPSKKHAAMRTPLPSEERSDLELHYFATSDGDSNGKKSEEIVGDHHSGVNTIVIVRSTEDEDDEDDEPPPPPSPPSSEGTDFDYDLVDVDYDNQSYNGMLL
ncbi:GP46-like surface antigen, putative [Bodo saltans]|uniref:GP46-like surface antigen, putative n=1 Tax=Bodo saltans TaxID=75058 RepID=A0A0S4KQ64_BODSA|nr:GP46-like surface antigen, putative [Bodo saltans]|eukprot:CUI15067.1 GP46-like surface antigen, putative [Bodo saltans]